MYGIVSNNATAIYIIYSIILNVY